MVIKSKILFLTRDIKSVERFSFYNKDDYELCSVFSKKSLLKIFIYKKMVITHPQKRFLYVALLRKVFLMKNFFIQHGMFIVDKKTIPFPIKIFDEVFCFDEISASILKKVCGKNLKSSIIKFGGQDLSEMQCAEWCQGIVFVTQTFDSSNTIAYWQRVSLLKESFDSVSVEFGVLIHPKLKMKDDVFCYLRSKGIRLLEKSEINYKRAFFIGHYSTLLKTVALAKRPTIEIRVNDFLNATYERKDKNLVVSDFGEVSIVTCVSLEGVCSEVGFFLKNKNDINLDNSACEISHESRLVDFNGVVKKIKNY